MYVYVDAGYIADGYFYRRLTDSASVSFQFLQPTISSTQTSLAPSTGLTDFNKPLIELIPLKNTFEFCTMQTSLLCLPITSSIKIVKADISINVPVVETSILMPTTVQSNITPNVEVSADRPTTLVSAQTPSVQLDTLLFSAILSESVAVIKLTRVSNKEEF